MQTIYPEDRHGNVFRWDEKPREGWEGEKKEKVENEESAMWMVGRLKHNLNLYPFLFTRLFILILETPHKSKDFMIYENPKIRESEG